MAKRRLIRWSLILSVLAAFAVWLEPTRVVWGWLRGEAFYQGRPTSWWAGELDSWDCWCTGTAAEGAFPLAIFEDYVCFPKPNPWKKWLATLIKLPEPKWPKILEGDPASAGVLNELVHYSGPYVPCWAQEGLERIKMPHSSPRFTILYNMRDGPTRFAPGHRSEGGMFPQPTRLDGKESP